MGATGGTGLAGLGALLQKLADANDFSTTTAYKAFGQYLTGFSEQNASTTEYFISSMADFGWDETSIDPWTDLKESKLASLALVYRDMVRDLEAARQMQAGMHPLAQLLADVPIIVNDIVMKIPKAEAYTTELAVTHKACKINPDNLQLCELPAGNCDLIPDEIWKWLAPPRAKALIFSLDSDETRVVLNAPKKDRVEVANSFKPNEFTGGVASTFAIDGTKLLSIEFLYQDWNGNIVAVSEEWPYASGSAWVWSNDPNDEGFELLEDMFLDWMRHFDVETRGRFIVRVRDRAAREFDLVFMGVEWRSVNGQFEWYRIDMVF